MTNARPGSLTPNSPVHRSAFSPGRLFFAFLWIAITGGIGATLVGFAGGWWWVFDLASHFRVHWFALLACGALLLAPRGKLLPALLVGSAAALNLALIAPLRFLRDSRRGFGVQPTWNARHPWCMIPIDHCLVSEGASIVDRIVAPDVGSDHRPIIVDFRVESW